MVGLDNMVDQPRNARSSICRPAIQPVAWAGRLRRSDFDALPGAGCRRAERWLGGTKYTHHVEKNHADVDVALGEPHPLHRAGSDFGFMTLGMPYVSFRCRPGHADGIARFYRGSSVRRRAWSRTRAHDGAREVARAVAAFRETSDEIRPYDGYHIAVYVTTSAARRQAQRARHHQPGSRTRPVPLPGDRDPESGSSCTRSSTRCARSPHPMYAALVNRNPAQRQPTYQPGQERSTPVWRETEARPIRRGVRALGVWGPFRGPHVIILEPISTRRTRRDG